VTPISPPLVKGHEHFFGGADRRCFWLGTFRIIGVRVDFLSIVQTAKMSDLNSEAYLRDALARIAEGHPIGRIDELMPWVAHS
jgi:hypothetical protein